MKDIGLILTGTAIAGSALAYLGVSLTKTSKPKKLLSYALSGILIASPISYFIGHKKAAKDNAPISAHIVATKDPNKLYIKTGNHDFRFFRTDGEPQVTADDTSYHFVEEGSIYEYFYDMKSKKDTKRALNISSSPLEDTVNE